MDLYALTNDEAYLKHAKQFAELAITKFHRNGLFVSVPGGQYYESKLYVGDLLAGLLRLHLAAHPDVKDPGIYDWSF